MQFCSYKECLAVSKVYCLEVWLINSNYGATFFDDVLENLSVIKTRTCVNLLVGHSGTNDSLVFCAACCCN